MLHFTYPVFVVYEVLCFLFFMEPDGGISIEHQSCSCFMLLLFLCSLVLQYTVSHLISITSSLYFIRGQNVLSKKKLSSVNNPLYKSFLTIEKTHFTQL